ncbi:hypothetical protein GCM10027413_18210 [Conyzicola nivalis]|uniref:Peptidase n=1 Tax=Conyzicola nivalis TaxID=1477021 RepID=A0A916SE94_9MICO|nr:Trp biosynthesis-associated membrane protein [Conyzicola nivalis]GGA96257.1 hypothetical protein GCM10010979_08410 [Conyzicola nivalis]
MTDAPTRRAPRRTKSMVILASAVLAILTLVSWTQVWFGVTLVDGTTIDVDGQVAAPALSALALTSLVLVGALSIAGPVFRVVFGALESLIGVAVVFSGVLAADDPVAASASAISTATGVSGASSVADLVDTIDGGFWPWLVIVCGVLIILAGVAIIVTSRTWPTATRKYQAARLEPADAQRTSVDDWDSLSGGKDPTTND